MFIAPFALGLGLSLGITGSPVPPLPAIPIAAMLESPSCGLDATQPPVPPSPAAPRRHTTVSLRWENDVVGATDDNYTNGISLTVSRDGGALLGGIWRWLGAEGGRKTSSYEIGQLMVTPQDVLRRVPDPADRPYAGLLYGAIGTQLVRDNRLDGLKFITGVVGPASLAGKTQREFHTLIGNVLPQGWAYQLKNEPIVNMVYEQRRRYTLLDSPDGWGAEVIPLVGGMLGNVLVQAEAESQFRIGYNLPDDFGTTLMRGVGNLPFPRAHEEHPSSPQLGAYLFAGVAANVVARNLTLDGNTFRSGPRVDKKPVFPGAEVGVSVWTRWFETTLTYVYWGREYETQAQPSRFGAATIALHF